MKKPIYEIIREMPVFLMLDFSESTLRLLERQIEQEQAKIGLTLKWIRGIRKIKKMAGGQNG